ncbi:MAG: heat-inducible transcriptional repressor HrcA [bacterium]
MFDKLSNRQNLILKTIIEEYVDSNEPVGSKQLTEKPHLAFSSATIRYDMAYLEEVGLLTKTHTSSGRIPSEEGYRYYVENFVTRNNEVIEQFPLIDQLFNNTSLQKEELLEQAINLVSDMTSYMTVASSTQLEHSKIMKIDLVKISESQAVMLVVTNQGHVENIKLNIPNYSFEDLQLAVTTLDKLLNDKYISDISEILSDEKVKNNIKEYIVYYDDLTDAFTRAFAKFTKEKVYQSNIDPLFNQPEFQDINTVKRLLSTISNGNVLDLVSNEQGLSVRIGQDNQISSINDCTVISIPYQIDNGDSGTIAVIGPTRMEYNKVIPLLEYIANNMSKLFDK